MEIEARYNKLLQYFIILFGFSDENLMPKYTMSCVVVSLFYHI